MVNRRDFLKLGILATSTAWGCAVLNHASENPMTISKQQIPDYHSMGTTLLESTTPVQDGFFVPAEWEPHEFTIMVFPPAQNWQGYGWQDAQKEWATVANTINEFEPVLMVINPGDRPLADRLLSDTIERIEFPVNDGWSRDSGPLFLVNGKGERRVAGFTFNGWGGKFPPYDDDALLKARLCKTLEVPMYVAPLVLEGGGVIFDGEGTIITTEECLLHPNRNPGWSKEEVETALLEYLGAEQVIWLGRGIVPDPVTDGHVDGICAYAAPGVVLLHTTDDHSDANFVIGNDAKQRLQKAKDAQGRSLEIIEIPLGETVAHMNFYLTNGGVIVPIANDPKQDDIPLGILQEVFPDRDVIGVQGVVLAAGGGGVHCITQQVPLGSKTI